MSSLPKMNHLIFLVIATFICSYVVSAARTVPQHQNALDMTKNFDSGVHTSERDTRTVLEGLSIRQPRCFPGMRGLPVKNGRHPSHIFFAADNEATLYINGNFQKKVNDWQRFETVMTNLKKGDIIAIVASNKKS